MAEDFDFKKAADTVKQSGAPETWEALITETLRGPNRSHDEAMRMQALAIGARCTLQTSADFDKGGNITEAGKEKVVSAAKWAYREATGREW